MQDTKTNQALTLEETIKKILKNKSISDRFLKEATNNVLRNRDNLIRIKNGVVTTIGVVYLNNFLVKCKDNGEYVKAQKAYVSSVGEIFSNRDEAGMWYFND